MSGFLRPPGAIAYAITGCCEADVDPARPMWPRYRVRAWRSPNEDGAAVGVRYARLATQYPVAPIYLGELLRIEGPDGVVRDVPRGDLPGVMFK